MHDLVIGLFLNRYEFGPDNHIEGSSIEHYS
jgi:hypothetical protein